MMKVDCRAWAATLCAACLALLPSCGGGDEGSSYVMPDACGRVGNPDFTGPGYGAIGPGGGAVEDTNPSSPTAGVRVEVEPGAWSECWEVQISYASMFDTPDYPDGFVPFERPGPSGAVQIEIGLHNSTGGYYHAPDPLPIKVSFPLANIHPGTLDVYSAYFFTQQAWKIALPNGLTADRLTVETTAHDALWSWGRVDLGEIDFAQYLRPALEAYYGSETLKAIADAQAEIARQAQLQKWQLTCAGLAAAQQFFTQCRDSMANRIDEIQAGLGCGDCNPLTAKFQEELDAYWQVKQLDIALDIADIVTMKDPIDALGLALKPWIKRQQEWLQCLLDPTGCLLNQLYPETACKYDCYFEKVPFEMNVDKALYHGCDWVRGVVEHYRRQKLGCP